MIEMGKIIFFDLDSGEVETIQPPRVMLTPSTDWIVTALSKALPRDRRGAVALRIKRLPFSAWRTVAVRTNPPAIDDARRSPVITRDDHDTL